jgi:hypothetical protein
LSRFNPKNINITYGGKTTCEKEENLYAQLVKYEMLYDNLCEREKLHAQLVKI